jgi:hypothetical protein
METTAGKSTSTSKKQYKYSQAERDKMSQKQRDYRPTGTEKCKSHQFKVQFPPKGVISTKSGVFPTKMFKCQLYITPFFGGK